ncbi:OST-HTH/LOTUS domain-containing protein [Actinophytocola glycyrrhizae]|uniref:OST-HTH/LOTUS domain-containing protein n=1 Tax=Actinophytocola glycyrrhizae TaxID=2044873 RepID=A0ABV9SCB2_9PSEU
MRQVHLPRQPQLHQHSRPGRHGALPETSHTSGPTQERRRPGQPATKRARSSLRRRWLGTLASVGHITTKQRPEFDSRTYGYAKLSDLITATTLFDSESRSPGDGKPGVLFVRDMQHQRKKPQ